MAECPKIGEFLTRPYLNGAGFFLESGGVQVFLKVKFAPSRGGFEFWQNEHV